jgi:hypothetical protein
VLDPDGLTLRKSAPDPMPAAVMQG